MDRRDAVVVGAGPAGSTAALCLARAGWSVLLVERARFPRRKVCGEFLSATNWPLLASLGVIRPLLEQAGPPVHRTAILAGHSAVPAPLPQASPKPEPWGRALSRERLDPLLAAEAVRHGAELLEDCQVTQLDQNSGGFVCRLHGGSEAREREVHARVAIAAHGSWHTGPLATQPAAARPTAADLLAFKAHFRRADLPAGLMPLVSFQDGYGGLVECDDRQVSWSCCIRRDRLERLQRGGQPAGAAVLAHVLESCPAVRAVLERAELEGGWLSAGPIRPGIRPRYRGGLFVVGNAAGEAHPVVAEGISMAMQSAGLLAQHLLPQRGQIDRAAVREEIGRRYAAAWRRNFAGRIRAAALVAHWAMRPGLVQATLPVLRGCPRLITMFARLAGKSQMIQLPAALSLAESPCP